MFYRKTAITNDTALDPEGVQVGEPVLKITLGGSSKICRALETLWVS